LRGPLRGGKRERRGGKEIRTEGKGDVETVRKRYKDDGRRRGQKGMEGMKEWGWLRVKSVNDLSCLDTNRYLVC